MDKFTQEERLKYLIDKYFWLKEKGQELTGTKAKEIINLMALEGLINSVSKDEQTRD
ncbi:MAG: hypothetical protein K0U41_05565 [Gammaproteobacteria bacterium]|nr:hypothetical protein [Gammaproteobacteria bacterium]